MVVNLLWLVFCVPIFTIGVATSAFYEATRVRIVDQEGYVLSAFFGALRSNFRRATVIQMIWGPFILAGGIGAAVSFRRGDVILGLVLTAEALVFTCLLVWSVTVAARFNNTARGHCRNGLLLALAHPGSTLLLLVCICLVVLGTWMVPALVFVFPVLAMTYWVTRAEKVFKKHGSLQRSPSTTKRK